MIDNLHGLFIDPKEVKLVVELCQGSEVECAVWLIEDHLVQRDWLDFHLFHLHINWIFEATLVSLGFNFVHMRLFEFLKVESCDLADREGTLNEVETLGVLHQGFDLLPNKIVVL